MAWQYVSINRCPGSLGHYQRGGKGRVYDTLADLLDDSDFDIAEVLDDEPLPPGAEDIRGRIRDEPDRVFVFQPPGDSRVYYFGADAVEED